MSNMQGTPHLAWQAIETCLHYAKLACYPEAAAYLLHVREQILGAQPNFAAVVDAFLASHTRYREAQQALQSASRSLVLAESEQCAWLARMARMLPEAPVAPAPPIERWQPAAPAPPTSPAGALPALTITCFGRFGVRRGDTPLALCASRNGQAILRYLAVQPQHSAPLYVLTELLWPGDEPEVARHKLHVAASALRRALNADLSLAKGSGYLLCDGNLYQLSPAATIHVDMGEFVAAYQAGQRSGGSAALAHYQAACQLYAGPFLIEDLYADWTQIRREQLVQMHLEMCAALAADCLEHERYDAAIGWAGRMLEENRCDEAAYRQLMLAYAATGRRAEALRQFQRCRRLLGDEMGIAPAEETVALFEHLQRGELPHPARALGA